MKRRITRLLGLPARQLRPTALLFVFAFGTSAAYICSRSAADALFLERAGVERLPAMFLVAAASVAVVTSLYARLVLRWPVRRLVAATHLVLALLTVCCARLLDGEVRNIGLLAALYVLAEIRGTLGSIHFTTLLNEMFKQGPPTAASGVAGFGSTLAGLMFGALIGWIASAHGTVSLFVVCAGVDLIAGFAAQMCRPERSRAAREPAPPTPAPDDDVPVAGQNGSVLSLLTQVPITGYLAALVCLKAAVVLLIQYEWKATAADEYLNEDQLTSYFGSFYAAVFFATGLIQLLATGRLLSRYGAVVGLAAYPLALLGTLSSLLMLAGEHIFFRVLTVARGCDAVRRGWTDPATHILYWPLDPAVRRQLIALIGGWVKPIAEATTAALLIPLTVRLSREELAIVIGGLTVVWLCSVWMGRRFDVVQAGPPDGDNASVQAIDSPL